MAMVMVASVKGSPGVTTTAIGMTATWRRSAILAELDPSGGDIRYRLNGPGGRPLSRDPSLVTFGQDLGDAPDVRDYVQGLRSGIEVLLGLHSAEESLALDDRWAAVGGLLSVVPQRDVIADCGRLHPGGPTELLFPSAAALLVVTRPTVDGVAHLRSCLESLESPPPTYVAVVTGATDTRSPRQVQLILEEAGLDALVLGRVAYDSVAAGTLAGAWNARLSRSWLIRSCRDVSARLVHEMEREAAGQVTP
jgi:hypothetical protein